MKHDAFQTEWFPIPSFEDSYEINKDGAVRSIKNGIIKIVKKDGNRVSLYKNKKTYRVCVDYLKEEVFGVYHIQSQPNEIWKDIKDYEGFYKISNKGRVLSVRKIITRKNGVTQFCKEQIVKPKLINSGYYIIVLIKNKVSKKFLVHRLVADHFIENPQKYDIINHKDENRLNNVAENLEWCNRSYNQRYGTSEQRRIATRLKNNNGKYGYKRKENR